MLDGVLGLAQSIAGFCTPEVIFYPLLACLVAVIKGALP